MIFFKDSHKIIQLCGVAVLAITAQANANEASVLKGKGIKIDPEHSVTKTHLKPIGAIDDTTTIYTDQQGLEQSVDLEHVKRAQALGDVKIQQDNKMQNNVAPPVVMTVTSTKSDAQGGVQAHEQTQMHKSQAQNPCDDGSAKQTSQKNDMGFNHDMTAGKNYSKSQRAFMFYDDDHNLLLSEGEFLESALTIHSPEIFAQYDLNKDNALAFSEFEAYYNDKNAQNSMKMPTSHSTEMHPSEMIQQKEQS